MTLQSRHGTFLTGTGAVGSTVVITGVGFTPTAIIFYWNGRTEAIDTAGSQTHRRGMGFASSPTQRGVVSGISNDGVSPTGTAARITNAVCVSVQLNTALVDGELDLTSFDADGFTLDVTNQFGTSYRISYLAIGGTDNAEVGLFTLPVATGNQDTVLAGAFQPDALLLLSSGSATAPPATGVDSRFMLGMATSASNQGVVTGGSNDGVATTDTKAYSLSGECCSLFNASLTAIATRGQFVQFNSNGFRINFVEVSGVASQTFYLALRGGGSYLVGNLLTQTDTVTPITESGFGFEPVGALLASANRAESIADTPTDHDSFSVGAFSDASTRGAQAVFDEDAVGTSDIGSALEFDEVYANLDAASTIQGLMDIQSVGSDGFTCIMDDADPSPSFVLYLAMGNAAPAPPTPDITPASTVSSLAGASETSYYLIINDALGNRMAVIQDYESLTVKRTVNGVGALVFIIPGYYSIDTIKVDGIVELWRAPRGGSWRLEFQQLWFIRERYKVIVRGRRYWHIVAYDLNYLLGDPSAKTGRIVAYTSDFRVTETVFDGAFTDKAGAADDVLKRVARENVGDLATDTNRNLSAYLSFQAAFSAAASVKVKMERRNLLSIFQELCQASTTAGTYLAFDILCLTPPNSGAFSIELQTFTLQRGLDHRLTSNQPVLIGPDFGNLDDVTLGFVNTTEVTYVYAAGQNESANQPLITSSDSARINLSPFNRRETFVSVGQTADLAVIQDEADTKLRAGRPLLTLTGTLIETDQARYGIHWNFGDYVTAQVDGYSFDARIDTVQLVFSREAGEVISTQIRAESVP